jgi:hypothetical protein
MAELIVPSCPNRMALEVQQEYEKFKAVYPNFRESKDIVRKENLESIH